MKLQLSLPHELGGNGPTTPKLAAVRRRMVSQNVSQNVEYGRCTESKTVENASQAVQRVELSKNSSFTGADNLENKTAGLAILNKFVGGH